MSTLTIGQLARAADVGIDTVRYYERCGLLPEPARRPSGYRDYPAEAVRSLRFIRRAKELGFTLEEIAQLLRAEGRASAAQDVKSLADRKLADLEGQIRDLRRMHRTLRRLAQACPARGPAQDCSILRALTENEGEVRCE